MYSQHDSIRSFNRKRNIFFLVFIGITLLLFFTNYYLSKPEYSGTVKVEIITHFGQRDTVEISKLRFYQLQQSDLIISIKEVK